MTERDVTRNLRERRCSLFLKISYPPPLHSITIHILHDYTLTQDNRDKFLELTNRFKQIVKFYNVEELCADKINKYVELVPSVKDARVSRGAFFKFLIPHILPAEAEKVIYLDADIIVNLDINELWQIELGNKPLAAVLEIANNSEISRWSQYVGNNIVKEENYFNSGMMLMNLNVLRNEEENILAGIKFRGKHPKFVLFDQEIFNQCFETRVLNLPVKFNRIIKESRINGIFSIGKEIYHYAGGRFGLNLDMSDPYNRLWMSYFIKTPWFSVDTMDTILKTIRQLDTEQMNSTIKFFAELADKKRVFVVSEENVDSVEKRFSVREYEEVIIIDPESNDSFQRLTDLMGSSKDKKVFFTEVKNIASKLKRKGFVEGKDFFNNFALFSTTWTSLISNYSIIMDM